MKEMVRKVGLEPTRHNGHNILSIAWLPLHHFRINVGVQRRIRYLQSGPKFTLLTNYERAYDSHSFHHFAVSVFSPRWERVYFRHLHIINFGAEDRTRTDTTQRSQNFKYCVAAITPLPHFIMVYYTKPPTRSTD